MSQRLSLGAALFLLPAAVFFLVFALGPMLVAVGYSFTDWNGLTAPSWIGLENWVNVLSDATTGHALLLTVGFMGLNWILQTPLALLLGVYLAGRQKYRALFGVFYFIPLLLSAVAIGITWSYVLDPSFGPVNAALEGLGLPGFALNWLGNPSVAFYVVVLVVAWQFVPFHMLLYQAGARQIPHVLYDAAQIDGAGKVSQFRHVTLPQLKYTVVTSTVLILTGSLTYFDLVYVMTSGGPGNATNILPLHMYETAFEGLEMGYGSMLAVILAVFGMVLSLVLLRVTGFSRMESQQEGL